MNEECEKSNQMIKYKIKGKQVFQLLLICIAVFGVLCITGCGNCFGCLTCGICSGCDCDRCEVPSFKVQNDGAGCSVPGCGGCFTYEKGCNTALWPQAIKFMCYNDEFLDESGTTTIKRKSCFNACDDRYYGDGCLGCGQNEKACYAACLSDETIATKYDETVTAKYKLIVIGQTGKKELIIGCGDGIGCISCTDSEYFNTIYDVENDLEID